MTIDEDFITNVIILALAGVILLTLLASLIIWLRSRSRSASPSSRAAQRKVEKRYKKLQKEKGQKPEKDSKAGGLSKKAKPSRRSSFQAPLLSEPAKIKALNKLDEFSAEPLKPTPSPVTDDKIDSDDLKPSDESTISSEQENAATPPSKSSRGTFAFPKRKGAESKLTEPALAMPAPIVVTDSDAEVDPTTTLAELPTTDSASPEVEVVEEVNSEDSEPDTAAPKNAFADRFGDW